MQQSERIELIKAAATLTAASLQEKRVNTQGMGVIQIFEMYFDYLQLKLEAISDVKSS